MKRINKVLAITSSVILILNYLEIQIGMFFFKDSHSLIDLEEGTFRVIYIIAFGTAFFYFAKFFSTISERKIEKLIYLSIILSIVPQAVKLINFPEQPIISGLFYLLDFIVVIIWGIKILKLKDSIDKHIRLIKYFVISLFCILTISFAGIPILFFLHFMDYLNFIFLLYVIPYTILTSFFLRLEKN